MVGGWRSQKHFKEEEVARSIALGRYIILNVPQYGCQM